MSQPAPGLDQSAIDEMSPAARDEYYRQQAAAGAEGSGLFAPLNQVVAQVNAGQQSQDAGQQNVETLSDNSEVQYVDGLKPSDADYAGHEHETMSQYVTQNLDPQQIAEVSTAYHDLSMAFKDFGERLNKSVATTGAEWEGPAAGQALGYFGDLGKWADGNSTNAKLASETIYQQSEAATTAKNTMPDPVPFNWDSEMEKWGGNPLDFAGNVSRSIDTYNKSNEAHDEAATVMSSYDSSLYTAASKQPVFAEPPKFGDNSVTPPPQVGPTPVAPPMGRGTGPSGSSTPPGGSGSGSGGNGGGGRAPGGSTIPPGGPTPTPRPLPKGPGTGTGAVPPGNTAPSGYKPPSPMPAAGGGGQSSTGMGGMGGMMGPMGAGGMGGGNADYNSKVGRGGGFGPGGSGGMGSGASSGAAGGAKPGGIGAAEAAAGRGGGAAAAGGGRGAGGMGGMGAGGAKGKGDEDAEHNRPSYLVEGDPDDVFGTDQRTAPPVIGE